MRIAIYIPDLLFGSGVVTSLRAAGHDPVLVMDPVALEPELSESQVLIVDLTADAGERITHVLGALGDPARIRTLGFYSHVDAEVREQAEKNGFDLVVPRSRMAREGVALVERLSE